MPFLSPSGSPSTSPRSRAVYKFSDVPIPAPPARHEAARRPLRLTYIPPLIDGACGTTPNLRPAFLQQLRNDLSHAIALLPLLLHGAAAAAAAAAPTDLGKVILHAALALLEVHMLALVVPFWLCLPGALFAAWVACCGALVVLFAWPLNGRGRRGQTFRAASPAADGWTIGQEVEDEQWFFIGGLGTSSRSLTKSTLPALATLFNRTISAVHEPTYGLVLDILLLFLQRSCNYSMWAPSLTSRARYTQIRTSLLDAKSNRTVVLAHNAGALKMSYILQRLYADVPTEKLSKLDIYTFGAAAVEFVMPLGGPPAPAAGSSNSAGGKQQVVHHTHGFGTDRPGPHIEHFAFANDPFARMGVLRSVHEDLAGRFCGSVFVLHCLDAAAHHLHAPAAKWAATGTVNSARVLVSLNDYLSCLFPEPSLGQHSQHGNGSILDEVMTSDRSLAEKREFAALAKDPASSYRTGGHEKRTSWTGLGATASGKHGTMDGVLGLERARKGCRDCSGHRGREVSRLASYVGGQTQWNDSVEKKGSLETAVVSYVHTHARPRTSCYSR